MAALTRQPQVVRRLIISGATVDLRDRHGNTALHIACAQSDLETVYEILAPISQKDVIAVQKMVNYPIGAQRLPNEFLELRNYEGLDLFLIFCFAFFLPFLLFSNKQLFTQIMF